MAIPDEDSLVAAIKALRIKQPELGRAKVLRELKEQNSWQLSDDRLKTCMNKHNLGISPAPSPSSGSTPKFPKPAAETTPSSSNASSQTEGERHRDNAFNHIIKKVFEEFTRLERSFLLALSRDECQTLLPLPLSVSQDMTGPEYNIVVVCQRRHHVELLLTLKGVKPCFAFYYHTSTVPLLTKLVTTVLKPLIENYHLESYGFALRKITHSTVVPVSTEYWKDGWIFADTRSAVWPDVQAGLLPSSRLRADTREAWKPYVHLLGKALGYPVPFCPNAPGPNKVMFLDIKEATLIGQICGHDNDEGDYRWHVVGLEYFDQDGDEASWTRCLKHSVQCIQAMESVGHVLIPDFQRHPNIEKAQAEVARRYFTREGTGSLAPEHAEAARQLYGLDE